MALYDAYNMEKIREFVENNSDCKLLSEGEYKGQRQKLRFKCSCGEEFTTAFAQFKYKNVRHCKSCTALLKRSLHNYDIEYVRNYVKEHGNGTILLSNEYKNNGQKLLFKCSCGEEFTATFGKFKDKKINKTKCGKCRLAERDRIQRENGYKIAKEYIESYGCKIVSKYENAKSPIDIKCSCGNIFTTSYDVFRSGKTRCDICSNAVSKNELKMAEILKDMNINFETEYRIKECKYKSELPFDFAIFNKDKLMFLIEVDGQQHFRPVDFFGGEEGFKETKIRDNIKNEYCKNNNIPLLRIPYTKINNIEYIKSKIKTLI